MVDFRSLLNEALDLCVRARKMDAQDRTNAALAASSDPEDWVETGTFDRYVERHNWRYPDTPMATRSATIPMWVHDQYQTDLADWERRARHALMQGDTPDAPR